MGTTRVKGLWGWSSSSDLGIIEWREEVQPLGVGSLGIRPSGYTRVHGC